MAAKKGRVTHRKAATKQPRGDVASAIDQLESWASAGSTATFDETLHRAVGGYLLACARRPASQLDPFEISLA